MRLSNEDIFTRPILKEISEDFNTTFNALFDLVTHKDKLELKYNLSMESNAFKSYCLEDKIIIGLHLYSQSIMYRKFIELNLNNLSGTIELDRDEVYSKVEISPILIANANFSLNSSGELIDSEDENYFVKKGMILGYAETIEIEVDYSKTNLNDLVVIKPTENQEQSNMIEIRGDQIVYYLVKEEYNSYNELYTSENPYTKRLIKIVHNAIYTRLLYYIIEARQADEIEEVENTKFFEFITQLFEENFPNINVLDIESDQVNKYAVELSDISFVNISVDGEEYE